MKKVLKSLPSVKTTVVTIVVALIVGALAQGIHPKAFFGLVLAAGFLALVTFRNYDPDAWEAHNDPVRYSYRIERDRLFHGLKELTEAVETDSNIVAPDIVAVKAIQARAILNQVSGQDKSPAQ